MLIGTSFALTAGLTLASVNQEYPKSSGSDDAIKEVLVYGRPLKCRPLENDPRDAASLRAPVGASMLRLEQDPVSKAYRFPLQPVEPFPLLPAGQWRRVSNAFLYFVFREPNDGSPMCLGLRKSGGGDVAANWQQDLDPAAYVCQFVRLTVFVATQKASARIWMNGGRRRAIWPWLPRTTGWMPVKLEDGPIRPGVTWIGFGLTLIGGDVWMHRPEISIVPGGELSKSALRQQRTCRRYIETVRREKATR
jgi:hypothetical protein